MVHPVYHGLSLYSCKFDGTPCKPRVDFTVVVSLMVHPVYQGWILHSRKFDGTPCKARAGVKVGFIIAKRRNWFSREVTMFSVQSFIQPTQS